MRNCVLTSEIWKKIAVNYPRLLTKENWQKKMNTKSARKKGSREYRGWTVGLPCHFL